MDRRLANDLDRWITGRYGDDQFTKGAADDDPEDDPEDDDADEDDDDGARCPVCQEAWSDCDCEDDYRDDDDDDADDDDDDDADDA